MLPFQSMKSSKSTIGRYYAIFEPAKEGGFNVSFPHFVGCYTFGQTFEEAHEKAQEVLELWIEVLTEEGKEIPKPDRQPILDEIHARLPNRRTYATTHRKAIKARA